MSFWNFHVIYGDDESKVDPGQTTLLKNPTWFTVSLTCLAYKTYHFTFAGNARAKCGVDIFWSKRLPSLPAVWMAGKPPGWQAGWLLGWLTACFTVSGRTLKWVWRKDKPSLSRGVFFCRIVPLDRYVRIPAELCAPCLSVCVSLSLSFFISCSQRKT